MTPTSNGPQEPLTYFPMVSGGSLYRFIHAGPSPWQEMSYRASRVSGRCRLYRNPMLIGYHLPNICVPRNLCGRMPICGVIVKRVIGIGVRVQRQKDRENGSTIRRWNFALYLDCSSVPAYNLGTHPKAETGAGIALGAYKGFKDLPSDLRLNPGSTIRDS